MYKERYLHNYVSEAIDTAKCTSSVVSKYTAEERDFLDRYELTIKRFLTDVNYESTLNTISGFMVFRTGFGVNITITNKRSNCYNPTFNWQNKIDRAYSIITKFCNEFPFTVSSKETYGSTTYIKLRLKL